VYRGGGLTGAMGWVRTLGGRVVGVTTPFDVGVDRYIGPDILEY
jgi:hypothetical protein